MLFQQAKHPDWKLVEKKYVVILLKKVTILSLFVSNFLVNVAFLKKTYRYRFKHSSTSTTAGDVYLADSAQVPRVQAKYTTDSAQVSLIHVQVLGHG